MTRPFKKREMAVEKCSKSIPPILKQCFALGSILERNNIATRCALGYHPKASDCDSQKPLSISLPDSRKPNCPDSNSILRLQFDLQPFVLSINQNNDRTVSSKDSLLQTTIYPMHQPKNIQAINSHSFTNDNISPSRPVYEHGSTKHTTPSSFRPSSAQLSFILLKLRDELPQFFKGHRSYDIYDPKMNFTNALFPIPIQIRSRTAYKLYMNICRYTLITLYSNNSFELLKITKEDDTGEIKARWRMLGTPRLIPWRSQRAILDGFSTFIVDIRGKIIIHRAEKLMPSSRFKMWMAQVGLILGLAPRSTQSHADALDMIKCYK